MSIPRKIGNPRQEFASQHGKRLRWTLAGVACVTLVIAASLYFFYSQERTNILKSFVHDKQKRLSYTAKDLRLFINRINSDALYLSSSSNLRKFAQDATDDNTAIEQDWIAFMSLSGMYDQIRYIEAQGNETIRVEYNDGTPTAVSVADLQNKSERDYVEETLALEQGKVFMSPLDLNMENGVIEEPHKPTIRFGVPIYNPSGEILGLLVVNYMASYGLQLLPDDNFLMADSNGYWMHGMDKPLLWGMMQDDSESMKTLYPEIWAQISSAERTVHHYSDRLVISQKVFPHQGSDVYWYLIRTFPEQQITALTQPLLNQLIVYGLVLTLCTVILGFGIIMWFNRAAEVQRKKMLELESMKATIGGICHELNQPLTVLRGYTDLIAMKGDSSPDTNNYVEKIQESSERVFSIMKRLRNATEYRTVPYSSETKIIDLSPESEANTREEQSTETSRVSLLQSFFM